MAMMATTEIEPQSSTSGLRWRRSAWLIGATAVLLLALAVFAILKTREPSFNERPLSAWTADLASPDEDTRKASTRVLRDHLDVATPYLIRQLTRGGSGQSALRGMTSFLPTTWRREILKRSGATDQTFRRVDAARALGVLGNHDTKVLRALAIGLADSSHRVQEASLLALQGLDAAGAAQIRRSLNALPSLLRWRAIAGLNPQNSDPDEVVPWLLRHLSALQAPQEAIAGGLALARFGPVAVPHVQAALDSSIDGFRDFTIAAASEACERNPRFLLVLAEHLPTASVRSRLGGIAILERAEVLTSRRCLALVGLIADPEPLVRQAASSALKTLPCPTNRILPTVQRLLAAEDPDVRRLAAEALSRMSGARPSEAAPRRDSQ